MPNTKTDHEAIQNEAVSATEGAAPTPSLVSKKAGNKNALFHGIYSDEIILPVNRRGVNLLEVSVATL